MKRKKIGIITFHAADNFGSVLQAYALEQVLKNMGFFPEIIDFILASDMEQYRIFRTNLYKTRPRALLGDLLYLRKNIKRKGKFKNFREKYCFISPKRFYAGKDDLECLNDEYDKFICGSDQIWNLNCTGGVVPELFLSFVHEEKKKIAYAPSMPSTVNPSYCTQIKNYLERLDAISVREKVTRNYLINEVGIKKHVAHVVDPTMLLDAEYYIKHFNIKKNGDKYIFVYILSHSEGKQELIELANKTADLTGLKIKYVYMRKISCLKNAEYMLGISPVEFVDMIYNASYVISDSFHASVFSILFHVPFCTFRRKDSEARMQELLEEVKLTNNLYSPDSMKWMNEKADFSTDQYIKERALESQDYLKKCLCD